MIGKTQGVRVKVEQCEDKGLAGHLDCLSVLRSESSLISLICQFSLGQKWSVVPMSLGTSGTAILSKKSLFTNRSCQLISFFQVKMILGAQLLLLSDCCTCCNLWIIISMIRISSALHPPLPGRLKTLSLVLSLLLVSRELPPHPLYVRFAPSLNILKIIIDNSRAARKLAVHYFS